MAFSNTLRATDYLGRGIVVGNYSSSGVTAGAFSVPFKQVYHASFCSNISDQTVTYASGSQYNIKITTGNGDSGTYSVYGE
jgi:hypothetical protein